MSFDSLRLALTVLLCFVLQSALAEVPTGYPTITYSTFLGGSRNEKGHAIATDSLGNVYVAGMTFSDDFPVTPGAYLPEFYPGCLYYDEAGTPTPMCSFVSKFDRMGKLLHSTYLPKCWVTDIASDELGYLFLTGGAGKGFPTTDGAYQRTSAGGMDAFVAKLDPTLSSLIFSTFVGGGGPSNRRADAAYGIAVAPDGSPVIAGSTLSHGFPVTPGAYQRQHRGDPLIPTFNWFIAKLDSSGSKLVASTYLGGRMGAMAMDVALDRDGYIYVTGTASRDFRTTLGAFQTTVNGNVSTTAVVKLNPSLCCLEYSTFFGANSGGLGITITDSDEAIFAGWATLPEGVPVTPGAAQTLFAGGAGCVPGPPASCPSDAFVAQLNSSGTDLVFSSYLGGRAPDVANGVALDRDGLIYVTGVTLSWDFPTTPGDMGSACSGCYHNATFLTVLTPTAEAIHMSTSLIGGQDQGWFGMSIDSVLGGINLDDRGNAYVTGYTIPFSGGYSTFPTTPTAFQTVPGASRECRSGYFEDCMDTFLTRFCLIDRCAGSVRRRPVRRPDDPRE